MPFHSIELRAALRVDYAQWNCGGYAKVAHCDVGIVQTIDASDSLTSDAKIARMKKLRLTVAHHGLCEGFWVQFKAWLIHVELTELRVLNEGMLTGEVGEMRRTEVTCAIPHSESIYRTDVPRTRGCP